MVKDKNKYSILVIEDNPGDFLLVEDFLLEQIEVPTIVHASKFQEAVSLLTSTSKPFDVVLLDLSLPDKTGEELVREILDLVTFGPLIILTGFSDIPYSIKSISLGVSDYLIKDELSANILYKSIIYAIERTKLTSQLKESESRYSNLFHLSPQPMWLFDLDTLRFFEVNEAAINLYGYTEEEFLRMNIMDIRPEEEISKIKDELISIRLGMGPDFRGTFLHKRKSGEIMEIEIYSSPIEINLKKYRAVIAVDVTERNEFENRVTRAIIKTQEDERFEIGGELHDNVCQLLAVSQLSMSMLKLSLPEPAMPAFEQSRKHIWLALEEIRNLSHRLAPVFFQDTTLEESYGRLLDTFNIGNQFDIELSIDKTISAQFLSIDLQLNLYRILQEQLRNILKYAKATFIEVKIQLVGGEIKMEISDNGIGFNSGTVKSGIGLSNIKRRAALFSGNMKVISSLGNGCTILINIPLEKKDLA